MTTQEVITELEILVPGNKQWDIEAMGSAFFKSSFHPNLTWQG
jgi:hypothetical protein